MGDNQDKAPKQVEIVEKQAFKLKAEGKLLSALEKLEEAMNLSERWYHFFYKAIWLHEINKTKESADTIIHGLNYDDPKKFFFRFLSARFLFRLAIFPIPNNIESTNQSINNFDNALRELSVAEFLFFHNTNTIQVLARSIPYSLKELYPTFLNDEDFRNLLQDERNRIEGARQSMVLFKGMVETESRLNVSIGKVNEKIDSERVRTIELLGIFTAIFAFIFSGVQLFTSVPLSEAVVLQSGMALIMIVFFLGVHLVTDAKARTKLLIGIFVTLLTLLVLFPFYARLIRDSKGNNIPTKISNHSEITTQEDR